MTASLPCRSPCSPESPTPALTGAVRAQSGQKQLCGHRHTADSCGQTVTADNDCTVLWSETLTADDCQVAAVGRAPDKLLQLVSPRCWLGGLSQGAIHCHRPSFRCSLTPARVTGIPPGYTRPPCHPKPLHLPVNAG